MREDVPLAERTTLGVGGPARYFDEVVDPTSSLAWARERGLPVLILGEGSNLVVADRGFDGLVLRLVSEVVRVSSVAGRVSLHADAGLLWDDLVAHAAAEGWAGIECLSGIPGCVGAAPVQNIGAYGQELADTLVRVHAIDRHTGEACELTAEQCNFAYRTSRFKGADRDRWIVTAVELALSPGGAATLTYGDLRQRLPAGAPLDQVRREVLAVRRAKSMLWDEEDPNRRSAGSFFVNPLVGAEHAERLAVDLGSDLPRFSQSGGRVKLAAAWLIERCGFERGFVAGSVGLSSNHALAIINRGGARAADVLGLARSIRDRVREVTGICLIPEPVFVGFSADELLSCPGSEDPGH